MPSKRYLESKRILTRTNGRLHGMTRNPKMAREIGGMKEGRLHGFQLWINMPAKYKKNKPEYIYIDSKKIIISCKDRSIEILELQRSGKKIQLKENFILGFKFDEQI